MWRNRHTPQKPADGAVIFTKRNRKIGKKQSSAALDFGEVLDYDMLELKDCVKGSLFYENQ